MIRPAPMRALRAVLLSQALFLAACAVAPETSEPAQPITQAADRVSTRPAKQTAPMPEPARLLPEADLWTRFAAGRHWQPCEPDAGVQRWIERYAGRPDRFAATLAPAVPLMDYVLTRSAELGLPSETMLIPIIESHYRADARGPGGALGLWQLMPDTGRRFGLSQGRNSDDRTDVHAATDAALRLLKLNADAFSNNPKLTFAAYNAGAYRLRKALAGRDYAATTSLDGLGLSRTTRDYLDKVKALGCLLGEPERFNLVPPAFDPGDRLVEWRPPYPVDPDALAQTLGLSGSQFKDWNRRAYAQRAGTDQVPLLIPTRLASVADSALAQGQLAQVKPQPPKPVAATAASHARVHRVAPGDSLWEIAKRYRVRLADLMRWNGLNKRSVLRIGQPLVVGN